MKRSAPALAALALALCARPGLAAAQEAAPAMPEDPRAPRYHEVERGFWAGFEAGYLSFLDTKVADAARYPLASGGGGRSNGIVVGLSLGYDITNWLALSGFVLGSGSSASASYGSFSAFVGGADLRAAMPLGHDANGAERVRLYLHARAGYLISRPEGLFASSSDTYLAGGPGLEYDTHLRHFTIGLAVDGTYVLNSAVSGFAITPTVRYTF